MRRLLWISVFWLLAAVVAAQWTNRYPKLEGYSHHVYVEGFELPVLSAGPTDPAPAPDGRRLAFAASGWLWLLDLESGKARRLTDGPHIDSRPAWSSDGERIAFLRDDTLDIDIWAYELATGEETPLVDTDSLELDPAFSPDGEFLYYSSSLEGDVDVWRLQLATSESMRLTTTRGLELRPLPLPDGGMVFLEKARGGTDALIERTGEGSETRSRTLASQSIASQTHPGISPDGSILAVNWPTDSGYALNLVDRRNSDVIELRSGSGLPLSPAFSADGQRVYFTEANSRHDFQLQEISIYGGAPRLVHIREWDWGERLGSVSVATRLDDRLVPARVSLTRTDGHPVVRPGAIPRFDGTHGRVYMYSDGVLAFDLPAGEYRVRASHGFVAPPVEATFRVTADQSSVVPLELRRLANPRAAGWLSGDHHYHMNYGGPYRLLPRDLELALRAEDVDFATPLMANLHHRLNDREFFSWSSSSRPPWIEFGQEVRSHFLGHLGLIHIGEIFWPWFWGPGYPVYADDDRPNLDALRHARRTGGMATYMHPVSVEDPFADATAMGAIPLSFIPDAVLGDLDAIELACLWTSETGTAELWYRVLNVGVPLAASAGTDAMVDYYRTMAVGATRVYVDMRDQELDREVYLARLREGRSFVTTGPILDVRVDGKGPGDIVGVGRRRVSIDIVSVVSIDRIELVVNGARVWSVEGAKAPLSVHHETEVDLPDGGWVAVRAVSDTEDGPGMNSRSFAHTSPVWIGEKGSRDAAAALAAATELLAALEVAETRLRRAYDSDKIPRLIERFVEARRHLTTVQRESELELAAANGDGGRGAGARSR